MAHHPLVQVIRSLVSIARELWPHDPSMTLIKSRPCRPSDDQADRLENYVLEHDIHAQRGYARRRGHGK